MQFCELPRQLYEGKTLRRDGTLVLLGYPYDRRFVVSQTKTAKAEANYFALRPTTLHATIAEPPSKPLSSGYDPERDVLLNYTPNDPEMKPHGFSGAAVWCDRAERSGSVWAAEPMIFGVQTSAFISSKLLQVVGAPTIKDFLERSF